MRIDGFVEDDFESFGAGRVEVRWHGVFGLWFMCVYDGIQGCQNERLVRKANRIKLKKKVDLIKSKVNNSTSHYCPLMLLLAPPLQTPVTR